MVEEIAKNLYRIPVPLEGNPLRELNSYFIRGTDRDLLIDTGFRTKACLVALEDGLDAWAEKLWDSLNEQNKVSLYVSRIDLKTGAAQTRIINKHDREDGK